MADLVEYKEDNPKTAVEQSDWRLAPVGWIFVATLLLLMISPLVLIGAFRQSVSDTGRQLVVEPAPPRLQVSPSRDLARFRAAEARRLNTYYWIDRKQGTVHIPIPCCAAAPLPAGLPPAFRTRR